MFNTIKVNNADTGYTHSIFDISEYTSKTYDTLSDALTDVPDEKQKGGMTVCYETDDNKYVQYRLMSDTFNTTEANWQGVDDEPTANSKNLVKSAGIFNAIPFIKTILDSSSIIFTDDYYIREDGVITTFNSAAYSDYIEVSSNVVYTVERKWNYLSHAAFYDDEYHFISSISSSFTTEKLMFLTPPNAKYIRINVNITDKVIKLYSYGLFTDILRNGKINIEQIDGVEQTDIFTTENAEINKYVDQNGNIKSTSSINIALTDYIKLTSNNEYIFKSGDGWLYRAALYNENKEWLSTYEETTGQPLSVRISNFNGYIRINYNTINLTTSLVTLTSKYWDDKGSVVNKERLQGIEEYTPYNLVDSMELAEGSENHYIKSDGQIGDFKGLAYYDYARVNPSSTYKIKITSTYTALLCFYDKSKTYISGLANETSPIPQGQFKEFTTPSNCYYIRVNKLSNETILIYSADFQDNKYYLSWMPKITSHILVPLPESTTGNLDFNTRNVNTFVGGMNYVLTKLFEQRPRARIIMVTHFSRDWTSKGQLSLLVKAQEGLARYWQCPLINLCDNLNWVNRDGVDTLGANVSDHLHPAYDYDETTGRSKNIDTIAKICANFLLKVYPSNEWTDKKVAWFGTSIPDGIPKPNIDNCEYPKVAIEQLLGGICYNYSKSAAVVRQKTYSGGDIHESRDQFSNDSIEYNANNTGVFSHDYTYGHITYKTYIIDKLNTEEEPDLYVFDFGFNDFLYNQDFLDLNFNSIP